MDALAYLSASENAKVLPLYVLPGDEDFLKREVLRSLRRRVLGTEADTVPSVHDGDDATFADVFDDLDSIGLFAARRLVVVENADPFVSLHRAQLEKKIAALASKSVLVLDVKTWPGNTRLAKMVANPATIVCKAPPVYRLPAWCVEWAKTQQQKKLSGPAAQSLVDLVGAEMGLLAQEIEKLATYVGRKEGIEVGDVDRLVGQGREENVFKILDALVEGRKADALAALGRLFDQGEPPMRLIGAFGFQLRRLAQAARLVARGQNLTAALEAVGVQAWGLKSAENQLKHLGRRRADRLYDWLMEINMGLRGDSMLPDRTLIERMFVRFAAPREDKETRR